MILILTFSLGLRRASAVPGMVTGNAASRRMAEAAGDWEASCGTRPMDGVERLRQSHPRPDDRRADPVIEMLAVKDARLTLPPWSQEACRIGHNILI